MHTQTKQNKMLEWIANADYLPILASLVIGFVLAWSIVNPNFQEVKKNNSNSISVNTTDGIKDDNFLSRAIPAKSSNQQAHGSAPTKKLFGEFQDADLPAEAEETVIELRVAKDGTIKAKIK